MPVFRKGNSVAKKLKLFEVRDNGAFIGVYYALNGKAAIARSLSELNAATGAFRRSGTRFVFTNPTAVEVEPKG